MRRFLLRFVHEVRQSYWFVPALMTVGAIVLGFLVPWVDAIVGDAWLDHVPFVHALGVDGARGILTTIAGSVIGVAGVTFSIAIAAVSFASGTYGPRLIGNFMRDRGNQFTLGTFVAAFVYCVVVLRAVQSSGIDDELSVTVPQASVLVAMALMLLSIAVLIFFIHHVPESINIMNIAARIGADLRRSVDTMFPEREDPARTDEPARDHAPTLAERGYREEDMRELHAAETGYIQQFDLEFLDKVADEQELIIRVLLRPGSFVVSGDAVLRIWPKRIDGDVLETLRGGFAIGSERTNFQDVLFLVDELVEIASRALSPGVNDPFTANACMDWMGAGLIEFARRAPDDELVPDGNERVVAYPVSFERVMANAWNQSRQYIASDRNATLHAFGVLARIAEAATDERRHEVVTAHIDALAEAAVNATDDKARRAEIAERRREALRVARNEAAPGEREAAPSPIKPVHHPDADPLVA